MTIPTLSRLPESLQGVMSDFSHGRWGAGLAYLAEDVCLVAFMDDALQAILEEDLSPITASGHMGMAGYTARIGAVFGPMTFDLISVVQRGRTVATEVEWSATIVKTGRAIKGRSCSVWTLAPDLKVQSLFTANSLVGC